MNSKLIEVISLIVEEFKSVPFHNLFLLHKLEILPSNYGGTCSDKSLNFLKKLKELGIKSRICSGFIKGKETHRLVQAQIRDEYYLIDIGNGWPAIHPFPMSEEFSYEAYGLMFQNRMEGDRINIYKENNNGSNLLLSVPIDQKGEQRVMEDVKSRFVDLSIYPFHNSIRFSQIVGDSFFFLKGRSLTQYRLDGAIFRHNQLSIKDIERILVEIFAFEFPPGLEKLPILPKGFI